MIDLDTRRQNIINSVKRVYDRFTGREETTVVRRTFSNPFPSRDAYLEMKKNWALTTSHSPEHHMLYNLLRGASWKKGFRQATNKNKVANGYNKWHTWIAARWALNSVASWARNPDRKMWDGKTGAEKVAEFLAPFGPSVTPELFLEVLTKID